MPRLAKSGNQSEDSGSQAEGSGCWGGVACMLTSHTRSLYSPGLQLRRSTRIKTNVPVNQPRSQTAILPQTAPGGKRQSTRKKNAPVHHPMSQTAPSPSPAATIPSSPSSPEPDDQPPHKAVRGGRYKIPYDFHPDYDTDPDDPTDHPHRYGVVTKVERGSTCIWFDSDCRVSRIKGSLEEWSEYRLPPDEWGDISPEDYILFHETEERAGYRWRSPWEVQELIRKAMVDEDQRTGRRVQGYEQRNDPADLGKHPLKKKNNAGIVFPVGLSISALHVAPLLHLFLLGKYWALKGVSSVPI